MTVNEAIAALASYAAECGLISGCERVWGREQRPRRAQAGQLHPAGFRAAGAAARDTGRPAGRRRRARAHRRGQRHLPRHAGHGRDGRPHPPSGPGDREVQLPLRAEPPRRHRLVLQFQPGHQLYPPRPHRARREVAHGHRVRRAGHHHKPLQAGEGPAGHSRGPRPARRRLSALPALRGERGLRGQARPPRPRKPPHRPRDGERLPLVPAVLPLRPTTTSTA